MLRFRNRHLFFADIVLILLSAVLSFLLRLDTPNVGDYILPICLFACLLLVVRLPLFIIGGLYRQVWRYAGVNEELAIVKACLAGSAVIGLIVLAALSFDSEIPFPRSVILIEGLLTLLLVATARFSVRWTRFSQHAARPGEDKRARRILVFGAGDAGAQIVREMRANPSLGQEPVAFLDDDPSKRGLRIHGVPVLGTRSDFERVVQTCRIDEALVAIPSAPGQVIRDLTRLCSRAGVPIKTIPGLYEILNGTVKVSEVRDVQLEDLLRREPVKIDLRQVGQFLGGARVLVTGAGGSIGSELCRQIARFGPERLILFELSENNLYQIHRELGKWFPAIPVVPILGDVRDAGQVDDVLSREQAAIVFHAAALKHVPLMESNVVEVAHNNILGTCNLVNASLRHHIARFVLVSTDKAVNPKSAMGATKRVAELIVQDAAFKNGCSFLSVRFGNVLGSSGSVVPLFKEQIAAGGPVTITHPEIRRYFMTIPEAASLIIQAAALGKGGETFVLDMGQAIRIQDLAREMIQLSGIEARRKIEIVFVGLRPGEKLQEELFTPQEEKRATKHQHIFVAQAEHRDGERLKQDVAELEWLVHTHDTGRVKTKLKEIVPEYSVEYELPVVGELSVPRMQHVA